MKAAILYLLNLRVVAGFMNTWHEEESALNKLSAEYTLIGQLLAFNRHQPPKYSLLYSKGLTYLLFNNQLWVCYFKIKLISNDVYNKLYIWPYLLYLIVIFSFYEKKIAFFNRILPVFISYTPEKIIAIRTKLGPERKELVFNIQRNYLSELINP